MLPLLHARLEEKLSDMEAENQYIRSRLVSSSTKKSPHAAVPVVRIERLFTSLVIYITYVFIKRKKKNLFILFS